MSKGLFGWEERKGGGKKTGEERKVGGKLECGVQLLCISLERATQPARVKHSSQFPLRFPLDLGGKQNIGPRGKSRAPPVSLPPILPNQTTNFPSLSLSLSPFPPFLPKQTNPKIFMQILVGEA